MLTKIKEFIANLELFTDPDIKLITFFIIGVMILALFGKNILDLLFYLYIIRLMDNSANV